jgi:hypothetical protein
MSLENTFSMKYFSFPRKNKNYGKPIMTRVMGLADEPSHEPFRRSHTKIEMRLINESFENVMGGCEN